MSTLRLLVQAFGYFNLPRWVCLKLGRPRVQCTIIDYYYESQLGSWLVAICERSENRGSGGGQLPNWTKIGKIGGDCSEKKVWFCRYCTRRQNSDGGYRFPLGPVSWGFLGSVNRQIDGPAS